MASGYGVIAVTAPGVAGQDAFDSEIAAFERAVLLQGLYAVLAAGRSVATGAGQVW